MNKQRAHPLKDHLQAHLPLKLLLVLVLYPAVYGPYHFLQLHHFFAPTKLQPSLVDSWIPFDGRFVWIYLSVYLLMPIGPVLMNTRAQLLRYAGGILLISLLADVVFVFHPTICPRPATGDSVRLYQILIVIDNPFHGFPSLHASFAIYSALCACMMLRRFDWLSYVNPIVWTWAALILYATLATKQHTLIDIVAGSALGAAVYFIVFHALCVLKRKALPSLVDPKSSQSIQPIA